MIEPNRVPGVIAEMSGGHDSSLERAPATFGAIGTIGTHAVRLRTHTADTVTLFLSEREYLSDHTLGIGVPIAATALGATVIEKHFTLDRREGGVDSAFSLEPAEMRALVEETRRAHTSLGSIRYGGSSSEEASKQFRRSLHKIQDVPKGALVVPANVGTIRPGFGLLAYELCQVLGRPCASDARRGTVLMHELLQ